MGPDLQLYLKDINKTALLTAEDEAELGWAIINHNCPKARERVLPAPTFGLLLLLPSITQTAAFLSVT